ncbi:hypothetical protein F5Y16DRAFT_414526 [Xylariaceae sp. FL0255]|nr:hypothetical protein F5Y16DRAFT_414526 [Xylariaceae sp. FL0255]
MSNTHLPYWQVNVPPGERTEQCPEFLRHVSEKDRAILSTRDQDFRRTSWEEVKKIIAENDLARFRRVPSDLRHYLEFKSHVQSKYGSLLNYVRERRLRWQPIDTPSGDHPFSNTSDYKILWNDWPYGIDTDIAHLVVWTKFSFDVDQTTDDITPSARRIIEDFVVQTFCASGQLDRNRLIWFKNWGSLKSVDGIEHVHVMLYKASEDFIAEITQGDHSLAEIAQISGTSISNII